MRRADRLFQIVQYLRGGRLLTAKTLADRLEVSERTIYRDIADLIGSGVPIDGEAGVGYLMREGYDLPPLMFNRKEITALVAGARMLRAWGGSEMALAAEEALAKIEAVLPEDARRRADEVQIFAPNPFWFSDDERKVIDRVEKAVERNQKLVLHYEKEDGTPSVRTVRPLGLWFWGKVWTLVGWCELRENFRMFRLDRMNRIEESDPFKPERGKTLADFYVIRNREC
ncbi:helix-turn-helix transcriptional regulator [Falsihalocynthiibacter sp. SS001]|uniref:helix-turn-helix transcriptional regulator n=1 Tax=Falsihalocynthiibacter sp. SS001 TaxID=3349698 RepID=UPI0036D37D89